jgi:hypothetical protein
MVPAPPFDFIEFLAEHVTCAQDGGIRHLRFSLRATASSGHPDGAAP